MTTRTRKTTKKSARKAGTSGSTLVWNLDDFAPEWATEGIERLNTVIDEFSEELQSRADALQSRGEKLRKNSQKRFEKRMKEVQKELNKQPVVKRAQKLRAELEERVEKNVDTVGDRVLHEPRPRQLDEVKKLERKIAQLNKKLRTLEKQQAA